jgi:hypothetical protein
MTEIADVSKYDDKTLAIHNAYYDLTWGHGSIPKTLKKVKEDNPDMYFTEAMVRDFLQKQKTKIDRQPIQHNTFVPRQAHQEYQADVVHFGKRKPLYGLAVMDIFTKRGAVFPMKDNNSKSVALAFHKFMVLNGIPATVSTDGGPEFQGVGVKDSFADLCSFYDIKRITLRSYPRFIDRFIRTIREMIWIRRETHDIRDWTKILPHVLQNYNGMLDHGSYKGSVHSATGMIPLELENNPDLDEEAHQHMQDKAAKFRPKPILQVGDKVRLLKAVRGWKASEDPKWGAALHSVIAVHHGASGTMYDISHFRHPVVRADLVFVGRSTVQKPSVLPPIPGARPLEQRLTVKQEHQAQQYKSFLPKLIRILSKFPHKKGSVGQLKALMTLPEEIKMIEFVRLYPRYLIVSGYTVQIRPNVRIPASWKREDELEEVLAPPQDHQEEEEPPPPPPQHLAKPPPPAPPPMVPPPPLPKAAPKRGARNRDFFLGLGVKTGSAQYAPK